MYKLPSANNKKPPLFLRVDESELHETWTAVLAAIIPELSINILFMYMIKAKHGASACLTFICGYIHHKLCNKIEPLQPHSRACEAVALITYF